MCGKVAKFKLGGKYKRNLRARCNAGAECLILVLLLIGQP